MDADYEPADTREYGIVATQPNFFIVGAPKCGTTALYEYLHPHPNVFMSPVKEPHFFAEDLGTYPLVQTLDEYRRLSSECTAVHLRRGEASVYYLFSSVAITNIRAFNPGAKIIAMLRNPVDMVHSLHLQLRYVAYEPVEDFEAAWRLQERRHRGFDLPPVDREAFFLQYAELGRLGTQVQRLLNVFPREQVKLILFDDLAASPQQVYDVVVDFLEIPHDGRSGFPRVNDNKRARVDWLNMFMGNPPPRLRRAFRRFKRLVGAKHLVALKTEIVKLNTLNERRPSLSPAFRAELVDTFRGEIALLSRLLQRDLSHWTAVPGAGSHAAGNTAVAPWHRTAAPRRVAAMLAPTPH
jgi:hypothetical protein